MHMGCHDKYRLETNGDNIESTWTEDDIQKQLKYTKIRGIV